VGELQESIITHLTSFVDGFLIIPDGSRDFNCIRAYRNRLHSNQGENAYESMRKTFPEIKLPSLGTLQNRVARLSGVRGERYDCCIESCMCFTGSFANDTKCYYCDAPRNLTRYYSGEAFPIVININDMNILACRKPSPRSGWGYCEPNSQYNINVQRQKFIHNYNQNV
jgi:hypothetical protein